MILMRLFPRATQTTASQAFRISEIDYRWPKIFVAELNSLIDDEFLVDLSVAESRTWSLFKDLLFIHY